MNARQAEQLGRKVLEFGRNQEGVERRQERLLRRRVLGVGRDQVVGDLAAGGKAGQVLVEGRVVAAVGDVDGDASLRREGGEVAVEGVIHRTGNEGHAYAHVIWFLSQRR
ncbi:MAG: hypothetical protein U0X20_07440 [Caldilineaceae bacterium]